MALVHGAWQLVQICTAGSLYSAADGLAQRNVVFEEIKLSRNDPIHASCRLLELK